MHYSVMLNEVIDLLNIKEDGIYVDCTLGYAGHSSEILKRIKKGHLFAFDQDSQAIQYSTKKLSDIRDNFTIKKTNFYHLKEKLIEDNVNNVDGILFDLGVSSPQLDDSTRGFSYHNDARLDMRMDKENSIDAHFIINNYDESELSKIFFEYGEEKYSRSIAKNIVKQRSEKQIDTTLELVEIIKKSVPIKYTKEKHPARKVFQALRICVNDEINILDKSIKDALSMLKVGGRCLIITFHSLEDRIVKNIFNEYTKVDRFVQGLPNISDEYLPNYKLINKKVIEATKDELLDNNRSRSAKLRVIERVK